MTQRREQPASSWDVYIDMTDEQGRPQRYRVETAIVWSCYYCSQGPMSAQYDDCCFSCNRPRSHHSQVDTRILYHRAGDSSGHLSAFSRPTRGSYQQVSRHGDRSVRQVNAVRSSIREPEASVPSLQQQSNANTTVHIPEIDDEAGQISTQGQRSPMFPLSASTQPAFENLLDHSKDSDEDEDGETVRHLKSNSLLTEDTKALAALRSQWQSATDTKTRISILESLGTLPPETISHPIKVDKSWSGWLRCQWEIPKVMHQLHASSYGLSFVQARTYLGNFVTITGSEDNMVISTCADFIGKTWGFKGLEALDRVSKGISQAFPEFLGSPHSSLDSKTTRLHATTSHLNILVSAGETDAVSFLDAVIWICTAVRTKAQDRDDSLHGGLQISKAIPALHIESAQQPGLVAYSIQPLFKASEEFIGVQSKCWTKLFTAGIIASRPSERVWGHGLEVSFGRMLHLCAVENTYILDGGIILHGFFTALVPISHDEASNSTQWHFERVEESCGHFLSPRDLVSTQQNWFKTTDISLLRESRCFVGWFENSNIMLGTRALLEHQQHFLQESVGTHEHPRSAMRAGFELGAQFGFSAGPINFQAAFNRTWQYRSHEQRFEPPNQYVQAVSLTYEKVALVLDSESKQAWLVPMLSLILHLCHIYIMGLSASGSTNDSLPFAAPCHDGASAAKTILESNGHLIVSGRAGQTDVETLRQLFLRINTNMINSTRTRRSSDSKRVFASELIDLIYQPARGSPLKEIKIHDYDVCWSALAEKAEFVGVCASLGQLIEPVPPTNGPVCDCGTLPSDRYLLAAHIASLKLLAGIRGRSMHRTSLEPWKFGEKAQWSHCSLHFTQCKGGAHQSIWDDAAEAGKVIQRITSRGKGKEKEAVIATVNLPAQPIPGSGVVVFGGGGDQIAFQRSSFRLPWE